jgi:hypothetical protein
MQCPSCVQRIHRGAEVCPHCGFSITLAEISYGSGKIITTTFDDNAGLLRMKYRPIVQKCMQRFSLRFPQFFFALYTRSFTHKADLRQYGFWFLNRTVFSDQAAHQSNASAVLLVMDAENKHAGLSFGYMLDPYLDEGDTLACLEKAQTLWTDYQYAEGIVAVVKHLEVILIRKHRMQRKDPHQFAKMVAPPNNVGTFAKTSKSSEHEPRRSKEVEP